jgi:NDP-sugar pyrophosphorylase family protein
MNLVVLAAGISSRMKRSLAGAKHLDEAVAAEALHKPKSMIGVGKESRPFLDYLLYNAREAGYRDIVLVVGEDDAAMRIMYGSADQRNSFHGLSISYARQRIPHGRTKPLGTADALLCALEARPDWAGGKFTVCNSDNLYSHRALRLLLDTPHGGALIDYDREALGFESDRIRQFAVIAKNADGYLTRIIEKPSREELLGAADENGRIGVSMNIFRFSYDAVVPVLKAVPLHPVRHEKELPPAVMMLVARDPRAVFAHPLAEVVPDLTSVLDVERIREYLGKTFVDFSW